MSSQARFPGLSAFVGEHESPDVAGAATFEAAHGLVVGLALGDLAVLALDNAVGRQVGTTPLARGRHFYCMHRCAGSTLWASIGPPCAGADEGVFVAVIALERIALAHRQN